MTKILVVDDDPQLRQSFEKILTADGHMVTVAATGEAGVESVRNHPPDLVIMDVRMPGMSGLEAFREIQKIEPKLPVLIMTAYGTTETAIEATKMGAFDYVLKPFEIPDILDLIAQALRAGHFMRSQVEMDTTPETTAPEAIIGRSDQMQNVYKSIGRVAAKDATVLVRGESGTGKELAARALYQHSAREQKPFLIINCVAIPETLLESELFGYEKGAFTGAVSQRVGKIEQANGGTVFLDEIGDMPYTIQAKILRLLQEKSIERLGGRRPIPVDVRIIAATNRNLEEAVADGRFREDLYYRLNVVTIWMPPLRERKGDIPLLTDYFLARFSREIGISNPGMTDDARSALQEQAWPGNVRELGNTLQKTLIFSRGYPVDKPDIQRATIEDHESRKKGSSAGDADLEDVLVRWIQQRISENASDHLFEETMDYFASILTREALNVSSGNRTQASKILGLSRPTLLAKIEKYKLKIETSVS